MNIDPTAPLLARRELLINAPVEKVWRIQADINNWPAWQPDIAAARLEGSLQPGSVFHWKAQGMNITSRLHTVEPNRRIGWSGKSPGMTAVHNWSFEPRGDATLVTTEESLSGWLARLLVTFSPHYLEKSLAAALQKLKAAAEN